MRRGSASSEAPVLGSDGNWHHERLPSERTRKELAGHRFDLDTALKLAREMAPRVTLNGLTAEEALARHQHGPWCREPLLCGLMEDTETWEFTRRERAWLTDAVMVLMHQIERSRTNDLSEMPDLQRLLDRLMARNQPA